MLNVCLTLLFCMDEKAENCHSWKIQVCMSMVVKIIILLLSAISSCYLVGGVLLDQKGGVCR